MPQLKDSLHVHLLILQQCRIKIKKYFRTIDGRRDSVRMAVYGGIMTAEMALNTIQLEISRISALLRNDPSEHERFVLQCRLRDYREMAENPKNFLEFAR